MDNQDAFMWTTQLLSKDQNGDPDNYRECNPNNSAGQVQQKLIVVMQPVSKNVLY